MDVGENRYSHARYSRRSASVNIDGVKPSFVNSYRSIASTAIPARRIRQRRAETDIGEHEPFVERQHPGGLLFADVENDGAETLEGHRIDLPPAITIVSLEAAPATARSAVTPSASRTSTGS